MKPNGNKLTVAVNMLDQERTEAVIKSLCYFGIDGTPFDRDIPENIEVAILELDKSERDDFSFRNYHATYITITQKQNSYFDQRFQVVGKFSTGDLAEKVFYIFDSKTVQEQEEMIRFGGFRYFPNRHTIRYRTIEYMLRDDEEKLIKLLVEKPIVTEQEAHERIYGGERPFADIALPIRRMKRILRPNQNVEILHVDGKIELALDMVNRRRDAKRGKPTKKQMSRDEYFWFGPTAIGL